MGNAVEMEIKGNIAIISLNRPERKNAINHDLLKGLYQKIEEASANDDVRALIITGKGTAFCSGIDLKALENGENLFDPVGDGTGMPQVFKSCQKPIIGAVNGYAITGGFEIALNCDFLIASEKAIFRDTHAVVGIHPGWGMTQLLPQAVGIRRAKQISMTCEPVDAQKAFKWGLVNEVVSEENLMNRAVEIADMISSVNQDIMQKMKNLSELGNSSFFNDAVGTEDKEFKKFVAMFT